MKKNLKSFLFTIAFCTVLGMTTINAQKKDNGTKEKSPSERVKDAAKERGFSAEKTPGGGGGICKDVTHDVKVCVDKTSASPKNGYGAHVSVKFK